MATLGVLVGAFLAAVEGTIVSTAMPTVVDHLGGLSHYSWVFSAYILTSTVTMPLWGRLSDLHGRRPLYLASIAIFLVGSALSGASQSMGQLIAFRALQGVGAGGLLPLGMTIMAELHSLEDRARAQSRFSIVWGIASIVGPVVGGVITETLSWRYVFYLNIPFGIVAAVLVGWALQGQRGGRPHDIDYRGAITLSGSATLLLIALGQTGERAAALSWPGLLAFYVSSAALGAWFVRIEGRVREPILPLTLLENQYVGSATLTGFLAGIAMFGVISFVPLFVQSALGRSATQAGSALTPLLLGWVTMSLVTGRVLNRVGPRRNIGIGLTLLSLGFFGLVGMSHSSSLAALYLVLALMGMGMGMTMLPLIVMQQSAVARDQLGVVTSLGQFSRSIGGAVGVAIMGAVMSAALSGAPTSPTPADLERALHLAFITGAAIAVLALASVAFVPASLPRAGSQVRPHVGPHVEPQVGPQADSTVNDPGPAAGDTAFVPEPASDRASR